MAVNNSDPNNQVFRNQQAVLSTCARILAHRGENAALNVLAIGDPQFEYGGSNFDWGIEYPNFSVRIELEPRVYATFENTGQLERTIQQTLNEVEGQSDQTISEVRIVPKKVNDPHWQAQAKSWLAGETVSNQGRVRSDNIAGILCDGLLFRSGPEVNLYKALKSQGVSFAPLPVFVRGGKEYQRMEPDFVILKDGICLIVEIDGDTYHQESPAEAHTRTTMLLHEGAKLERFRAEECDTPENASQLATRIMKIIEKIKKAE
jgi:hypothetical protein